MNPNEINRLIATEVMGWVEGTIKASSLQCRAEGKYWFKRPRYTESACDPSLRMLVEDFDPYHRIEHAHMALEKFAVWIVEKFPSDNEYICKVWKTPDYIIGPFEGLGATPSAAICEAIKQTVEGKE